MNFPKGAMRVCSGAGSSVFIWHGKPYRYAQGRKGGTIYVAHPEGGARGIIARAYQRRERRRQASMLKDLI